MINPTLFGNDIDNFPIIWDHVETFTMGELKEQHPEWIDLINYARNIEALGSYESTSYKVTEQSS